MARRLRASDPTKATKHKPEPVEVRNIAHPTIWKLALKIAENKTDRITVESFGRVCIRLP